MKNDPLVSVLMSIYKESVPVVSQAIDSIREQTYRNIEIIVLLDCPEYEELKAYLAQLGTEEPRLNYCVNEINMGLLDSLNKGLRLCHGDFICRMDADDYAETDRIAGQMDYMHTHRLDLVGSYTNLMDANGELLGKIKKFPVHHKYVGRYLKYANAVPHPTWLVRKAVYDELEGYRNVLYAEDYDFLIRACLCGYRMGVVPEPMLRYRVNRKGITQRNMASQKIVSDYLAVQLKKHRIFSEEEITAYRETKKNAEIRLTKYYTAGKRWKTGERLSLIDQCTVIFNVRNIKEIWERLSCKWILYRDGRYDHY